MYKKVLILLFFIPFQLLFAQKSILKDFPEGSTPEEIGKRLAYRFLMMAWMSFGSRTFFDSVLK